VEASASKAVNGVALLATVSSKLLRSAFSADAEEAFEAVFGELFAAFAVLGFFCIFYTENYTF
jgi:hypothetical protein